MTRVRLPQRDGRQLRRAPAGERAKYGGSACPKHREIMHSFKIQWHFLKIWPFVFHLFRPNFLKLYFVIFCVVFPSECVDSSSLGAKFYLMD